MRPRPGGERDALGDLEVPERDRLLGLTGHARCLPLRPEGARFGIA
jgi:hypothetical protein